MSYRSSSPAVSFESLESRRLMATIAVLNTGDAGADSLRAAVASAVDGDTIDLGAVSGTIALNSQVTVDKNLHIDGPGAGVLTITAPASGAFLVTGRKTVDFSDLTIANAGSSHTSGGAISVWEANANLTRLVLSHNQAAEKGGAVAVRDGHVTVTDSAFFENQVTGDMWAAGGAIFAEQGSLTVVRSTFENNWATAVGFDDDIMPEPGRAYGGGVAVMGGTDLTVTNSTFFINKARATSGELGASATGGGIYVTTAGSFAITNSTLVGNAATATGAGGGLGGGLMVSAVLGTGTITNALIAQNTASTAYPDVHASRAFGAGGNLIGDGSGSNLLPGPTEQIGTAEHPIDPRVIVLSDNGGLTKTMALRPDSPAVNAGIPDGAPAADQRGVGRVGAVDVGAYELGAVNVAPAFASAAVTAAQTFAKYTYAVAATDDDGDALAVTAVAKPDWLALVDHGDGTATLSGKPSPADVGDHTVTLRVGDGTTTADQTFTVSVAASARVLDGDVLILTGDGADNDIHAWLRTDPVRGDEVRVVMDGILRNYPAAGVKAVEVYGMGGNDRVLLNLRRLPGDAFGGDGDDVLRGGAEANRLSGGAGNDLLEGNEGNDTLHGDGGKDKLVGGAGDDRLYGGSSNDSLVGGTGTDRLFGEGGNDVLYARDAAADFLTGGAADDLAQTDADDTLEDLLNHLA